MSLDNLNPESQPNEASSFTHFTMDKREDSSTFLDRCQKHLEAYGWRIIIDLTGTGLTPSWVKEHFQATGYFVEDRYNGFNTGKVLVGNNVLTGDVLSHTQEQVRGIH